MVSCPPPSFQISSRVRHWETAGGGDTGRDRDREAEHAPGTESRIHPDGPAVGPHDLAGDGETEAANLRLSAAQPYELVEDSRLILDRDPGAVVGHRDLDEPAHGVGRDEHAAARP
jgi:hypothetical protein